jgi:hypothetical protein
MEIWTGAPFMAPAEATPVALRSAARLCDGWVVAASPGRTRLRKAVQSTHCEANTGTTTRLSRSCWRFASRHSVDLFKRAEDIGVTAVMCSPWAMADDVSSGTHDAFKLTADSYRAPIERFAEEILAKMS